MKLEVNISKKVGVINITSNSFVLEDLKAHICKKMKIKEKDFKMKISLGDVPKVELIEIVKQELRKNATTQYQVQTRQINLDYNKRVIPNVLREAWKDKELESDWDLVNEFRRKYISSKGKLSEAQINYYGISKQYRIVYEILTQGITFHLGLNKSLVYLILDGVDYKLFDMTKTEEINSFMLGEVLPYSKF